MHSPGERSAGGVAVIGPRRAAVELLLRTAVLGLVAWALWSVWRETAADRVATHVAFDGSPTARTRDSLAAHRGAGDRITWGGALVPLAAMVEPVREPGARWRVSVNAAGAIGLADSLGLVDSLTADERTVTMSAVRGALRVASGTTVARVVLGDGVTPGRVVVLGGAGWESKFVVAALEEAGWGVDARLTLGRDREVRQGDPTPRLARHAAVVVLDTAIGADAAALARFVRAGGGLVLAGDGARALAPALRAVAPGRVVASEPPETRHFDGLDGHAPTDALPLHVLGALRVDAVVLGVRDRSPTTAVRRVGAGRVAQMGFRETWRWRMQGDDRGQHEHRAFWSRLVASVAAVPAGAASAGGPPVPDEMSDESAPLAQLVHALGPAAAEPRPSTPRGPALPPWVGAVILGAALAEWGLRRRRGAV
ncbi:MAG: hypothetical protein WD771_00495 [Gemmatimonadaceae bacterium]